MVHADGSHRWSPASAWSAGPCPGCPAWIHPHAACRRRPMAGVHRPDPPTATCCSRRSPVPGRPPPVSRHCLRSRRSSASARPAGLLCQVAPHGSAPRSRRVPPPVVRLGSIRMQPLDRAVRLSASLTARGRKLPRAPTLPSARRSSNSRRMKNRRRLVSTRNRNVT